MFYIVVGQWQIFKVLVPVCQKSVLSNYVVITLGTEQYSAYFDKVTMFTL